MKDKLKYLLLLLLSVLCLTVLNACGKDDSAAEEEAADGLVLICVDGFPLGWAQKRGGQLKNKYNPGWRWQ